jgi:antitoxin (DNA-binding transcriptional repressor) of toxin-antitoxin stability system
MRQINLNEAPNQLNDLVQAAIRGEEIFLVTPKDQVVQLVPVVSPTRRRIFGSAKGMIKMSDDFDAPLEDFNEYLE